ncbi:MAG: putative cytosolic protein [Anaerophaga sp.]|jgi:hypothetical protein|uniref:hypothetical protein n=1 Tax=Anaerophaga thermohalophila TaxID=177400 RepID=UPI0002D33E7B|nr:hypothetical protein [Anaerophaga thermohalophila]MBZ4676401.1 putative cytosolic protein [Anaerophaga sp.]
MQQLIAISVECYSGYRADEYPIKFYLHDMPFHITEIIDRWYQRESSPDYPASTYFKVVTNDQHHYILKHALDQDKWFLLVKGEAINLQI